MNEQEWIPASEAAKRIRVHITTINDYANKSLFRTKDGEKTLANGAVRKCRLYNVADLDEWLRRNPAETRAATALREMTANRVVASKAKTKSTPQPKAKTKSKPRPAKRRDLREFNKAVEADIAKRLPAKAANEARKSSGFAGTLRWLADGIDSGVITPAGAITLLTTEAAN